MYLPLITTVVLKHNQEMFCVPLEFENNLTADALIDSGTYVSANALNELDTIKKAPSSILKIEYRPNF